MLFDAGIGARFKQGSSKRFARLRQVDTLAPSRALGASFVETRNQCFAT